MLNFHFLFIWHKTKITIVPGNSGWDGLILPTYFKVSEKQSVVGQWGKKELKLLILAVFALSIASILKSNLLN